MGGFNNPLAARAAAHKKNASMTQEEIEAAVARMNAAKAVKQAERAETRTAILTEWEASRRFESKAIRRRGEKKGLSRREIENTLRARRLLAGQIAEDLLHRDPPKPTRKRVNLPLPSDETLEPWLQIVDAEQPGLTWNQRKRAAVRLLRADIAARDAKFRAAK
jgi:hypothetical protein